MTSIFRRRTIDLPIFGEKDRSLLDFPDQLFLFLAVLTTHINVAVIRAIDFEIKVARIGGFVGLKTNKLNFILLVIEP